MEMYRIFGRKQITTIVLCAVLMMATLITAAGGAASVTASTQSRLLPIYAVGREENDKVISISFDAAWGNEDTQTLIDILGKYDIKATFFPS